MKYLSTFSGIEAASVAWEPLGWKPVGFSEIEPFPSAVLKHYYPQVQNYGDITQFAGWSVEPFRLLVGGSPCQSFSVAGLRKGLADERGNLMLTFGRLAQHYRPAWVVWENVPGVLSSNAGRDFAAFLTMLAEFGYGFAYRVLDAQYFGVAQRRRRVFVVAYLGDWRPAAAVLFDPYCMSGDPPPSREKGKGTSGGFADGIGGGSHWDNGVNPHPTLNQSGNSGGIGMSNQEIFSQRGGGLAPHTFKLRGGCDGGGKGYLGQDECAFKLSTHQDQHLAQPMAFAFDSLSSNSMKSSNPISGCNEVEISKTLYTTDPNPGKNQGGMAVVQPVGFHATRRDGGRLVEDVMPTVEANWGTGGGNVPTVTQPTYCLAGQHPNKNIDHELSGTLPAAMGMGGGHTPLINDNIQYAVRRLTPIECERLQGFPDNYTAIPWRGKDASQCPDGPRYKALGNSMAVPVMRWIGERIQAVDDMMKELNR